LEDVVSAVLLGALSTDEYESEIKDKFSISEEQARNIANDTESMIFGPIKESLTKAYESQKTKVGLPQEEAGVLQQSGVEIEPEIEERKPQIKIGKDQEILKTAGVEIESIAPVIEEFRKKELVDREEVLEGIEHPSSIKKDDPYRERIE